jgi:Lysozyme like domain
VSGTCQGAGGGGPGVLYSYAELEGLWENAGGAASLAPVMAAIAMAESGGCSTALNPTDNGGRQTSWGLWQISNGTHSSPGPNPLTGPGNAALAVAKYQSQGITAWGTYSSGAYKQFLQGSVPADLNVAGGQATLTAATAADCWLGLSSAKLFLITGPEIGGGCLITRSQIRSVAGVALMSAGMSVLSVGALVLLAYGLKSSGAGKAAARGLEYGAGVAEFVPPARPAAARVRASARRVRAVS